jgi:putative metallohydrolase (TIGR04338 family)
MRDSQRQRVYDAEGFAFLSDEYRRLPGTQNGAYGSSMSEAQFSIDPYPSDLSLERAQDLVDKVFQSKYVKRKWKHESGFIPSVKNARKDACRGYADFAPGLIVLPKQPYHRRQSYILHECAHFITDIHYGSSVANHGQEFCDIYLSLVRYFMSKKAHEALKCGFRAKNVKFSVAAKRTITPEHRAKLQQNAAKARLALKEKRAHSNCHA